MFLDIASYILQFLLLFMLCYLYFKTKDGLYGELNSPKGIGKRSKSIKKRGVSNE